MSKKKRTNNGSTTNTYYANAETMFKTNYIGTTYNPPNIQFIPIGGSNRINFFVDCSQLASISSLINVKLRLKKFGGTINNIYLTSETSLTSTGSTILENKAVVGIEGSDYSEVDLTKYLFTSASVLKSGTLYFGLYSETESLAVYMTNSNVESRPELVVEYIDECQGLLNQKTVDGNVSQSLNYSVNVRTGKPTFTKSLLTINTLAFPINLGLYFDSSLKNTSSGYMPKGWRFNYQQKLVSNSDGYEYIDGNGIHHQFELAKDNSVVYFDVAGTGLVITKYPSYYLMDDGYNNQITFDSSGKLTKIIRKINGNEYGLQFYYEPTTDNIISIRKYTKKTGATSPSISEVVKIEYFSESKIEISSEGFPTATLTVDSTSRLVNITEEDSRVSSYTYDSNGMLASATSDNGERSVFTYNSNYQVLTVVDCVNNETNILSKLTFDYKYLKTFVTNFFGVKKGYSFDNEGLLIGEYEVTSTNNYVRINQLDRTAERIQIAASSQQQSLGFDDLTIVGDLSKISRLSASRSVSLSVGNFKANAEKYSQLSFTYKFSGTLSETVPAGIKTYLVVMQTGKEIASVTLDPTKYTETMGNLIFKFTTTNADVSLLLYHNYDNRTVTVKDLRIGEINLTNNFFCSNYKTKSETDTSDIELTFDSDTYYTYSCNKFICDTHEDPIEEKMYYEDLVENLKNAAVSSTFNLWYNKKRGLVANVGSAQIPVYVDGVETYKNITDLKAGSILSNEDQYILSYSDYSSSEALKVDYKKVLIKNEEGTTNPVTISQNFINSNYQTYKTIDENNVIHSKTFTTYGKVSSETLKDKTGTNSITTEYTYDNNYKLKTETTVINGVEYKTKYQTDSDTGELSKIIYPNGLEESFTYEENAINKLKSLTATLGDLVNSNVLDYEKDLIKKYNAHANGLSLTYDNYNMPKCFYNNKESNRFWDITRVIDSSGYQELANYGIGAFFRKNLYDNYGNLYETLESYNGSTYSSILQLFYTDFDAGYVSQTSPSDSSLNKRLNSKLRKKIDNMIDDVTNFYYDNQGNLMEETHENNDHKAKKVLYNYDNYNRLTSKEVVLSDNSKFTDSVTYKNNYSEEVEKYSSDLVYNYSTGDKVETDTIYEKDSLGRIVSETTTIGSAVFRKEYTYQGTGANSTNLISKMVVKRNGVSLETYNYTYDNMGRITNIVNTSGSVNNRYTYDLLGRLIREDNKEVGTTTLFEYDTNGNMLKKSVADYSTSDTVAVKSEPSFTVSSDYADYIESYDGKAIETSSIGNITEVGTTTYSWTRAKLLSQVKESATDYVNYNYDGEGLRISKSHYNNGVTTTHTYIRDGKKILVEKINNGTTEKVLNYLYLGENVIGFVYNNAYYHFQKNLQNDIIAIYNESGIKVAAYKYDAWE